jgi:hypothetical protein
MPFAGSATKSSLSCRSLIRVNRAARDCGAGSIGKHFYSDLFRTVPFFSFVVPSPMCEQLPHLKHPSVARVADDDVASVDGNLRRWHLISSTALSRTFPHSSLSPGLLQIEARSRMVPSVTGSWLSFPGYPSFRYLDAFSRDGAAPSPLLFVSLVYHGSNGACTVHSVRHVVQTCLVLPAMWPWRHAKRLLGILLSLRYLQARICTSNVKAFEKRRIVTANHSSGFAQVLGQGTICNGRDGQ